MLATGASSRPSLRPEELRYLDPRIATDGTVGPCHEDDERRCRHAPQSRSDSSPIRPPIAGPDLDRASAAAIAHLGGGTGHRHGSRGRRVLLRGRGHPRRRQPGRRAVGRELQRRGRQRRRGRGGGIGDGEDVDAFASAWHRIDRPRHRDRPARNSSIAVVGSSPMQSRPDTAVAALMLLGACGEVPDLLVRPRRPRRFPPRRGHRRSSARRRARRPRSGRFHDRDRQSLFAGDPGNSLDLSRDRVPKARWKLW